jgi:alkaline phosphatase
MSLNGFPFRKDSGIALLGFNSAGQPWITWATGPHGTKSYGAAKLPANQDPTEMKEPGQEQPEPAALYTKSGLVTVEDVIAFGSGPGADALQGVVESTDIFKILRDEL